MQLKMQQLLGFSDFYEAVKSEKISMKTAYRLSQLASAIDKELQFYREKLKEILDKYGEKDEKGGFVPTTDGEGFKLRPGTDYDCFKDMQELQEIEVELPDIKFNIDDFGNAELSAAVIGAIVPFIEE